MAELDLSAYSTAPLFNTKAVVQETGVTAATLRAWERRYGVPSPDRTNSNYRLYSERDMALIRWLRERVDGGVSISQAVELYRRLIQGEDTPATMPGESRLVVLGDTHDLPTFQARLLDAFKTFDERAADQVLREVFALFSIEDVLFEIIQPVMIEVGEMWHRGEISVVVEHYATAYIKRRVMAIVNAQPLNSDAPLVLTGCAPHELHELGILLFSLLLRRYGLRVLYLGQNVPQVDLRGSLEKLRPAMVALSAMTSETAEELIVINRVIQEMSPPRPLFAYGGGAFVRNPELADQMQGLSLGEDPVAAAREAVRQIRRAVSE